MDGGFEPPATAATTKMEREHAGYFKESRTDLSMREVAPVDVHVDVHVEAGGAVPLTRAVGGGRVMGRRRGLLVMVMGLAVAVVVAVGVGVGVGVGLKGKGKGS